MDSKLISLSEKGVYNRSEKLGVVFSLISNDSGLVYIGSEYVGNLEVHIMDLLVRMLSFDDMGYLYDASYEVLKDMSFDVVLIDVLSDIKTKYELGNVADMYARRLGMGKCVNLWESESLLRKIDLVSLYDNDVRIRDVDIRKIELEKGVLEGLENDESRLKEYRKERMLELREAGKELYKKIIMYKVKDICDEVKKGR